MIDEDVLRNLFHEAADSAPPPGDLPDDLLTDVQEVPSPRFRIQPKVLLAAAAVVVLMVGVSAAFAGDGSGSDDTASETVSDDSAGTTGGGDGFVSTTMYLPDAAVDPGGATAAAGGLVAPVAPDTDTNTSKDSAAAGSGTDSALVVKTGSLTIEVKRGAYDKTLNLMTTKAIGLGGYVAQSSTSRNDDRPSGSLVLRVPSAQFDSFLADVRKLGDVIGEDTQGTDVSGEQADVEARLTGLRATRDKLGTVLAQAKTVDEILLVQDRITGVQTQIEQLQGQLSTLDDKVAMASLTVSLGEPGAERVELSNPDDRTIGGAWADARDAFTDGIEGIIAWSGSAAVVLLVGAALVGLGLLGWPRLRRHLM